MSWFDAAGLANIAKSALKEAQRTIDKALDIKDDATIAPANTPIDPNIEDFFGTWGITQPSTSNDEKQQISAPSSKEKVSNSIWGSFTGSFFENANEGNKSPSITSLDDTLDAVEPFSQSKLVVHNVEELDNAMSELGTSEEEKRESISDQGSCSDLIEVNLGENDGGQNSVKRREKKANASLLNRLSAVSAESGKNSSESADIITCSTECTTSPESEMLSTGQSISTSSSALGMCFKNAYLIFIVSHDVIEVDPVPRESSPISSESRSDLVKIGSDHTSGHTSGDELETTTSSDIEIISSPNGDSSSTQSRQSPAKQTCTRTKMEGSDSLLGRLTLKKVKGHNRELSEASSISDDLHPPEVDRLLKKIAEITEILESRESKLIDVNRRNAELQEVNSSIKDQLNTIMSKQLDSTDLSQVTDEYTQRISILEKKFQQAIREKDNYKKQLDQIKVESASRLSKGEMESLISEKEETIKELIHEGEKLSKQQLQHSNIIKKLRVKEKENENTIKHLKESVESLTTESDRLKKSLTAKDEVERTQIEAINQLTSKNRKLENEVNKYKGQLDDLTQKYDTTKKSLDAAKKELQDKTRTSTELQLREQMLDTLENQKKVTELQNSELVEQLEDMRQTLRQYEANNIKNEEKSREDINKLMRKLEEAETRNEELSQSVSEVSRPLIRQLESLQATHSMKLAAFEKVEEELTLKISKLLHLIIFNYIRYLEHLMENRGRSSQTGSNSPTLSLGKGSIADSMTGSFWSQDEPFEVTSTPRYTNMFEMQMLQSSLKQRDGELQQLQWELNRREQERSLLNNEIS
uniref:TATA element modulatory factor n=1 Tax=Diabrotica virgifera virgifera TaxID=50390 RepID=A0A6P7GEF4_DIAVI